MATKECACWKCRAQAEVPTDLTQEDIASAVVLCSDCDDAGCDPFDEHGALCQDELEEPQEVPERWPCARDTCNGEGHLLGILGCLAHYRCRACGIEFNQFLDLDL